MYEPLTPYEINVGMTPADASQFILSRIQNPIAFDNLHHYSADYSTDFLKNQNVVLLDLRPPDNYRAHHVIGSINFPITQCSNLEDMCQLFRKNHERWGPLFSNLHYYHLVLYDLFEIDDRTIGGCPIFPRSLTEKIPQEYASEIFFRLMIVKSNSAHFFEDGTRMGNFCRSVKMLKGGFSSFCSSHAKQCGPSIVFPLPTESEETLKQFNYVTRDKFCLWGSRDQLISLESKNKFAIRDVGIGLVIDVCVDYVKLSSDTFQQDGTIQSVPMVRHLHFTSLTDISGKHVQQIFHQRLGDIMKEINQFRANGTGKIFACSESRWGLAFVVAIAVAMEYDDLPLSTVLYNLAENFSISDSSVSIDPWAFWALSLLDLNNVLSRQETTSDMQVLNIINSTMAPKYWYYTVGELCYYSIIGSNHIPRSGCLLS